MKIAIFQSKKLNLTYFHAYTPFLGEIYALINEDGTKNHF